MLVEFVGGWWTNSLALIADAGHMLTDAASLALALLALRISRRPVDDQRSYGYARLSDLLGASKHFEVVKEGKTVSVRRTK